MQRAREGVAQLPRSFEDLLRREAQPQSDAAEPIALRLEQKVALGKLSLEPGEHGSDWRFDRKVTPPRSEARLRLEQHLHGTVLLLLEGLIGFGRFRQRHAMGREVVDAERIIILQ